MATETLHEIERQLDLGDLDCAQRLLAVADPFYQHPHFVGYLSTRLLYQRGRLTLGDALERMRELANDSADFPELQKWLARHEPPPLSQAPTLKRTTPTFGYLVPSEIHRVNVPAASPCAEQASLEMPAARPVGNRTSQQAAVRLTGEGAEQGMSTRASQHPATGLTAERVAPEYDALAALVPKAPRLPALDSAVLPTRSQSPFESDLFEGPVTRRSEPAGRDFDHTGAKARLSSNAGRYSSRPQKLESLRPTPASEPPRGPRKRSTPPPSDSADAGAARPAVATRASVNPTSALVRPQHGGSLTQNGTDPSSAIVAPDLDAIEQAVLANAHERAIALLEAHFAEKLASQRQETADSGAMTMARISATHLTTAPIFREFGPYDLSLYSIARVEAALDTLLADASLPLNEGTRSPLVLTLGHYVGETLRLCHDGMWDGALADPAQARVVVGQRSWHAFQLIYNRFQFGTAARLRAGLISALSSRNASAWARRFPCPAEPTPSWGNAAWPSIQAMSQLAQLLCRGVVARFCRESSGLDLDFSVASVGALDNYLNVVAPSASAIDPHSVLARKLGVCLGAYVGETLAQRRGAIWVYGPQPATRASDFRLRLRNTREVEPVSEVLRRLGMPQKQRLSDIVREVVSQDGELDVL